MRAGHPRCCLVDQADRLVLFRTELGRKRIITQLCAAAIQEANVIVTRHVIDWLKAVGHTEERREGDYIGRRHNAAGDDEMLSRRSLLRTQHAFFGYHAIVDAFIREVRQPLIRAVRHDVLPRRRDHRRTRRIEAVQRRGVELHLRRADVAIGIRISCTARSATEHRVIASIGVAQFVRAVPVAIALIGVPAGRTARIRVDARHARRTGRNRAGDVGRQAAHKAAVVDRHAIIACIAVWEELVRIPELVPEQVIIHRAGVRQAAVRRIEIRPLHGQRVDRIRAPNIRFEQCAIDVAHVLRPHRPIGTAHRR